MTLVSIITPSLNQAAFLEQTMRSVLDQDYGSLEYLVVDGGSTDGSLDIIRKFSERLAWWTSGKDDGQAEAINKGVDRARGEIIAWLNSDDSYLPGAVSAAVEAFRRNPGAVMVYGNTDAVDAQGRKINAVTYRQLSLRDLLCFQIIGQPAVFMKAATFRECGGLDQHLHLLLDHQLWIKLAARGSMVHLDKTLAAARFHPAAKNRARAAEFGREAFWILDWAGRDPKVAPQLAEVMRRAWASAHRVDARYLLDGGQPGAALKAWGRAFLIHPPTALARLNVAGSAMLELVGLGSLRAFILHRRQKRLSA